MEKPFEQKGIISQHNNETFNNNQNNAGLSSPLPNKDENPDSKKLISNNIKDLLQSYQKNSEIYYNLLIEKEKLSYNTLKSELETYSTKREMDSLINLENENVQKQKDINYQYETFPEQKLEQLCINPITPFQINNISTSEFICLLRDGLVIQGNRKDNRFSDFDLRVSNNSDLNYDNNIKQLLSEDSESAMLYLAYNIQ